jgi:hypothetical protein
MTDDYSEDDSYYAELAWETAREEELNEAWEKTYRLLQKVGWDGVSRTDSGVPPLKYIFEAQEILKNKSIHDNMNDMDYKISKNLSTLAKIRQQKLTEGGYNNVFEPLFF